ncbi:branched-chain amino acid ABC transporter permease (plasmid) [Paroceanicella profunda]|uniref:Branched-chain amino acid ABC transporter permease n=1 Tax=Paroceanicella profunda TaxID=2579971 RepID=A0A5B8G229_9RHOB|nr:branched-chain amino acid ABC transporter permease [Paroceanicella profunda]QDL93950.1 branched-chain amino acid ABC transporter permease [Paroceanicella profunda]
MIALAPRTRLLVAAVLFLLFAALPFVAAGTDDHFLVITATRVMVFAIAALSLDLILGYGALVSFGHAAYLGIGAYTVAILSSNGVSDLALQMLAAVLASAVFALVTGAISLRTKGVYFIMITLAFGQMAFFFFVSLSSYGGDDGFTLQARSTLMGTALLENDRVFFYVTLAALVLLFLFANALIGSRFGRVLTGTRENPLRMQAIGFTPFRYQLTAYVISGCMAGIAGVLLANQTEFVSPAFMTWHRSGELIVMVILGGIGTLVGGILGAAAFLMLEEWLAIFSEHWRLAMGVILVLVVLFTRGGLTGLLRRLLGGRA